MVVHHNVRRRFADAVATKLGGWVATVGRGLREPPDPLPIPLEYDLIVRTSWLGSTATVAVSVNGIEVTERFRFAKPIENIDGRFQSIVRRLWTRYLNELGEVVP